jgi:histidinol phosphatase-like PHP family hydrolase
MLTYNLHVHTQRSACARPEMTLRSIDRAAEEAGLEYVGLSDHIDVAEHNPRPLLNMSDLSGESYGTTFLVGCEATVLSPGRMAVTDSVAERLDYVMVSANHYHLSNVENPETPTPAGYAQHYLEMLEGVMDWGMADVIAHPFFHTKLRRVLDPTDVFQYYDWGMLEKVLSRAAEVSLAFEIKPGFPQVAPEFFARLVELCKRHGVKFSVGSDAHRLVEVAYPDTFEDELRSIGIGPGDLMDPRRLRH